MLENSYDIPGIRFGILISKKFNGLHNYSLDQRIKTVSAAVDNKECIFVPLDQVSGLQVREITDFINYINDIKCDCIVFSVYHHIKYPKISVDSSCGKTKVGFKDVALDLDIDVATECNNYCLISTTIYNIGEDAKDREFDDIVVDEIISDYSNASSKDQRWMRCFLQRHKYGTKDRVDEELPKVLQKQ